MLARKSMLSWNTTATRESTSPEAIWGSSVPFMRTDPETGSQKRGIKRASVVLPLPESPTRAVTVPGSNATSTSCSTKGRFSPYANATPSNSMRTGPSAAGRGRSGSANGATLRTEARWSAACSDICSIRMLRNRLTSPAGTPTPNTRKGTHRSKGKTPFATKASVAASRTTSIAPGENKADTQLNALPLRFVHT